MTCIKKCFSKEKNYEVQFLNNTMMNDKFELKKKRDQNSNPNQLEFAC
jgi:hypothetical protein